MSRALARHPLGLDKAASYYYTRAPWAGTESAGVNKNLWGVCLRSAYRGIAAAAEVKTMLAEFSAENESPQVAAQHPASVLRFDNNLIATFGKLTREVLADVAAKDSLTQKVYESYMAFLIDIMDWEDAAERGYLDSVGWRSQRLRPRRRMILKQPGCSARRAQKYRSNQ
jgi:TRAP-type mannitol/chloroaromatic compound transport system substrate-binding protein